MGCDNHNVIFARDSICEFDDARGKGGMAVQGEWWEASSVISTIHEASFHDPSIVTPATSLWLGGVGRHETDGRASPYVNDNLNCLLPQTTRSTLVALWDEVYK